MSVHQFPAICTRPFLLLRPSPWPWPTCFSLDIDSDPSSWIPTVASIFRNFPLTSPGSGVSSQSKTICRTLARSSGQTRSPFLFAISVTTVRVSVYSGFCTPVRRSARGSVPGCAQYDAATERNPVGISKLRVLIPIPRRSTRGRVDPGSCGLQVRCQLRCQPEAPPPRSQRRSQTVPVSPRQSQSPPSSQKAFGSDAVWKEGLVLLQIPHQIPEASPPHPLILVVAFFLTGPLKNTNIPSPCSFFWSSQRKKNIPRRVHRAPEHMVVFLT